MEVYQRFHNVDGKRTLSSPFWWFDVTDPASGERVRRSTKMKKRREAEAEAARIYQDMKDQAADAKANCPPISLADAVGEYLGHLESLKKSSVNNLKSLRDKLFGLRPSEKRRWAIDGTMLLHDLGSQHMEVLVQHRLKEGNSPQTIAHEIKLIRAAAYYAKDALNRRAPDRLVNGASRKAWRIPKIKLKTRYFTAEEWRRLYDYLDPDRLIEPVSARAYRLTGRQRQDKQDAQDLLVALTMCGPRTSEAYKLRWTQVDLKALEAWVAWQRDSVSTSENAMVKRPLVSITVWGSKTDKTRILGLPDAACEVLWRRYQDRRPNEALIFPGRNGVRKGTVRSISKAISVCGLNDPETVEESGRATVHSLRHTFASWLLQRSGDLALAKDGLGHASLSSTMRYAHLVQHDSAAKISNVLSQSPI